MPKWFQHVEEESISFRASKDLYNKFIGFSVCVVFINGEPGTSQPLVKSYVNGQRMLVVGWGLESLDLDNTLLALFAPYEAFGVVDFGQIDGTYVQFRLQVSGPKLKKWGF